MGTKLYVGNLNYKTSEEALREAFGADGRSVESVKIITDRDTGQPRGFAFVEMGSPADAQAAIDALNGQEL
ncbi:MAG TPA: RNA-binding protein, partial [Myxococcota bacterium]|nr:RNA-binding protein [Myxococcota bacterium]